MNCAEARFAIGAAPLAATDALEAHLHECAGCAAYRREMIELNQKIRTALLSLDPPRRGPPAT